MHDPKTIPAALAITCASIEAAAKRIGPHIYQTPLLESPRLNEWLGFRLLVKAENLQHTGSFKLRGATNAVWRVDNGVKHVFAYSSGNHAQGVARAASVRGIPATILMPADTPKMKVEGTKSYGADVVHYDRYNENREEIGLKLAAELHADVIKPYDDARVIEGQGTIGLEIAAQCAALGVTPDHVISCCGGGGLVGGTGIALREKSPSTKIWVAEPAGFDDTIRSLSSGKIEHNIDGPTSICDAIVTPAPGDLTFAINKDTVAGGFAVSDELVLRTIATAFKHLKIVIEPGGAVALAAALDKRMPDSAKTVVAIASGGNIDGPMFERALAAGPLI